MGDAFLAQAARGRGARWHYGVGLAMIVVAWVGFAAALYLGLAFAGNAMDLLVLRFGPWARNYVELNIAFLPLIPAVALVVALWHRRPVRSVVTGAARIAWGRIALAFAASAALFGTMTAVGGGDDAHPATAAALLRVLLLVLVLTPIQAASEELLFRGYVMQATAAFTRSRTIIIVFNGVLFAALHGANPAAMANPLALGGYFISGAGLALVALRDDGLELPIGGHVANNLLSFLVLAATQQLLESEAEDYSPLMHYVSSLAPVALLLALARLRPRTS
jgi:membrane protease YdiL (CAAX protease family)